MVKISFKNRGQKKLDPASLKIDEPNHVTTRNLCYVTRDFFIFKITTTECISYNTTKLKMRIS